MMKNFSIFKLLLLALLPFVAKAQSSKDLEIAINTIKNGSFQEGLKLMAPLCANTYSYNRFSPQAEYYTGYAYYQLGDYSKAALYTKDALDKTSNSKFKTEVRFLLMNTHLGNHSASEAIKAYLPLSLEEGNMQIASQAKAALSQGLLEISLDSLLEATDKYPVNEDLLNALRVRLPKEFSSNIKAGKLARRLNVGLAQYEEPKPVAPKVTPLRKGVWNLVVVLPLNLEKTKASNPSPQTVVIYDLLEGIRIAAKELADSGVFLQLQCYDTKGSVKEINKIINSGELQGADAIIGPVFGSGASELAAYAAQIQKPMFQPLSYKLYWDSTNAYALLTQFTPPTIVRQVAKFALRNLPTEKVAIIYGVSTKDSMLAANYRQVMQREGKKIVLYHKVGKNSAANLVKFLVNSGIDSSGHIFAPNMEMLVSEQLPAAMKIAKVKNLICPGDWLEISKTPLDDFEWLNTTFFYPEYQQFETEAYDEFAKRYQKTHILRPSEPAAEGYDVTWLIGRAISNAQGNENLLNYIRTRPHIGNLMGGFYFANHADNQRLPLFKLNRSLLERLN